MLSCKNVSSKVSESLDRKLTLRERFSVSIHLVMCKACQRFARQMELIRAISRRYGAAEEGLDKKQEALSECARQRILERLQHSEHHHGDHE